MIAAGQRDLWGSFSSEFCVFLRGRIFCLPFAGSRFPKCMLHVPQVRSEGLQWQGPACRPCTPVLCAAAGQPGNGRPLLGEVQALLNETDLVASSHASICKENTSSTRFGADGCIGCRAFVTKSYLRKASEARYLFFSDDLPDSDLQRQGPVSNTQFKGLFLGPGQLL